MNESIENTEITIRELMKSLKMDLRNYADDELKDHLPEKYYEMLEIINKHFPASPYEAI